MCHDRCASRTSLPWPQSNAFIPCRVANHVRRGSLLWLLERLEPRLQFADFAVLSDGVVTVRGTEDADQFGITSRGTNLRFWNKNIFVDYAAADVRGIVINAGGGADAIEWTQISQPVFADAGEGNDSIHAGSGNDTSFGRAGHDTLYGGAGADRLEGGGGHDRIYGDAGNDRLSGGAGNDRVDGGGGADTLLGGDGNDSVAGGISDVMDSGAGDNALPEQLSLGTMSGEVRDAGGRINIGATIDGLKGLGVNTFQYLIWFNAHDWEDLPAFADAAAKENIRVWVYVVPWTETPLKKKDSWGFSEPFRTDYHRWASEVATLSLTHTNIEGLIIDDWWINTLYNEFWDVTLGIKRFSPQNVREMVTDAKAINPNFKFCPLLYMQTPWSIFMEQYGDLVDGVIMAYPKSKAGVENATTFLHDQRHGSGAMFLLDRNRDALAGQSATISAEVAFSDPRDARLSFYFDNTNQLTTNTSREVIQVRLNGQTIWSMPADSANRDGVVDINLAPYLAEARTARLELGVYCTASGVPNLLPVEVRMDDIRVFGVGETPWKFTDSIGWAVTQTGEFETTLMPAGPGLCRRDIPVVLMPAGAAWQHRKRYNEASSGHNLKVKFDLCLDLTEEGVVQGMVPWCTPLIVADRCYLVLERALKRFPCLWTEDGTLFLNGNDAAEIIGVTQRGSMLRVIRNGRIRMVPAADVKRISICSDGGNDVIDVSGISVPTWISSGCGNDRVVAGGGNDLIYGGTGRDTLIGGPGNDSLFGGSGNDELTDDSGIDVLVGNQGDDRVCCCDLAIDSVDGGKGNDSSRSDPLLDLLSSIEIPG